MNFLRSVAGLPGGGHVSLETKSKVGAVFYTTKRHQPVPLQEHGRAECEVERNLLKIQVPGLCRCFYPHLRPGETVGLLSV